jgi:protein Mpv17
MLKLNKFVAKLRSTYEQKPFACNTVSCMALLAVGDALTQYMENRMKKKTNVLLANNLQANKSFLFSYDFTRTAKMFILGSPLGIVQHVWYGFLDNKFPRQHTKSIILKKVFIDQVCFSPIMNVVVVAGNLDS